MSRNSKKNKQNGDQSPKAVKVADTIFSKLTSHQEIRTTKQILRLKTRGSLGTDGPFKIVGITNYPRFRTIYLYQHNNIN